MKRRKKMIINFIIFLGLFIITYYLIFKDKDIMVIFNNLKYVNLKYILISILVMILYYLIEAINVKGLLKTFNQKISLLKSLKFTLIGAFFSSITPASSGGQPMEIYYMSKENIKISHSTLSLIVHLFGYQLGTIIFGIIAALLNINIFDTNITRFFIIGLSFTIIALSFSTICIFSCKLRNKLIKIFIKLLKLIKYKDIKSLNNKINNELKIYDDSSRFIRKHKNEFIKAIIIASFQVLVIYSVSYFIYKSFNLSGYNIIYIISIQAIIHCIVSSIPIPGTIGVSESVFLVVYSKIFEEKILPDALILQRGISFYLFVLISLTVVLINNLYLSLKEKSN